MMHTNNHTVLITKNNKWNWPLQVSASNILFCVHALFLVKLIAVYHWKCWFDASAELNSACHIISYLKFLNKTWDHQSQPPPSWICLRCLEQVKHILPNGGLMVIYHGTIRKTSTETNLKRQTIYNVYSMYICTHIVSHTCKGFQAISSPPRPRLQVVLWCLMEAFHRETSAILGSDSSHPTIHRIHGIGIFTYLVLIWV